MWFSLETHGKEEREVMTVKFRNVENEKGRNVIIFSRLVPSRAHSKRIRIVQNLLLSICVQNVRMISIQKANGSIPSVINSK